MSGTKWPKKWSKSCFSFYSDPTTKVHVHQQCIIVVQLKKGSNANRMAHWSSHLQRLSANLSLVNCLSCVRALLKCGTLWACKLAKERKSLSCAKEHRLPVNCLKSARPYTSSGHYYLNQISVCLLVREQASSDCDLWVI